MAYELRLKVVGGTHDGREIPVPISKFLIGRAEDCQLRPKSELISRHHCVLLGDGERFAVRDLGSRNGTFVNGEKIAGDTFLADGDRLTAGPLDFVVHLVESGKAKKRPKIRDVGDAVSRTAAKGRGDDSDIAEWLADDDEGAMSDTREISRLGPEAGRRNPMSVAELNANDGPPPEEVPDPAKFTAAAADRNCQEAAADALRRHLRKR